MRRVRYRSLLLRLRNHEEGAVATIVAVLVLGGVVMGMLALTVDVGAIWAERRQLQNGADATSLALADACARGAVECSVDPKTNKLELLSNANAEDGFASLDPPKGLGEICFRGTGTITLPSPACDDPGAFQDLRKCPPAPPWLTSAFPYVETYPVTKTSSGATILPKFFSQALTGGGADVSETACARAAWGAPASYTGAVPLTMSECEWLRFLDSLGGKYPPGPVGTIPGYGGAGQPAWPESSVERVIYFANSDSQAPCTYKNGKDGPGGFGDVQPTSQICSDTVETNGWLIGNNGKSVANPCRPAIAGFRGRVINVPVFDCLFINNSEYTGPREGAGSCDGSGKGGTYNYHIAGWAKFYLSGYVFPGDGGMKAPSYLTNNYPCSNSESCISGWFVKGALDATSIKPPGGPNDYGTYAVLPAG